MAGFSLHTGPNVKIRADLPVERTKPARSRGYGRRGSCLVRTRAVNIDPETMSTEHEPDAPEPLVSPRGSEEPVAPESELGEVPADAGADAPGTGSELSAGSGVQPSAQASGGRRHHNAASSNMLPQRERRRSVFERLIVRLVATCGIVGIGVAIAAIMVSSHSQGWIVGLVVSIVSVVLAALLWSSRML